MVKVFVIYDSKYGNTKLVAQKVSEGLSSWGAEANLGYIKEISPEQTLEYDALILGAPNHMGRPSRTMKNFINHIATLSLKDKKVVIFGTYSGKIRELDRAVRKTEMMVRERLPKLTLVSLSLSVRVNGVSGPVVEEELPKCVEFGKALASPLSD
jgi:flavorubredoxin